MKKITIILVSAAVSLFAMSATATQQGKSSAAAKKNEDSAATKPHVMPAVNLYSKDNADSQHETFTLDRWSYARPFFRKKQWIKVAFTDNGETGWVNMKQLRQAMDKEWKSTARVQAVYINRTVDKDGKPVVNVVAYKNGKKLSDQEAKALYQKIHHEEVQQQADFHRFNVRMDRLFNQEFTSRANFFGDDFPHLVDSAAWPNF